MYHLKLFIRYIKYCWKGKSKYFIHSPFVYHFVTEILDNPYNFYAYDIVEKKRKELLQSNETINVTDFGAGSKVTPSNTRSISSIARNAAKPKKFGQLLHRITAHYQPNTMLELGTSLGVSCSYQALGNVNGKMITMEGCPEIAKNARQNFDDLRIKNIEQVIGDFSKTLDETLSRIDNLDYAFFDGNHRKKPTLEYFHKCLPKVNENSILIFDDIHWSEDMEEAWEEIKKHTEVSVTIDLFFIGIVFFKKDQAKEDFVIRFPKPKEQKVGGINNFQDIISYLFK